MNWIMKEARKVDSNKDRIILENPASRQELDTLLMERFYPAIIRALKDTNLPYHPGTMNDININSVWSGPGLGRNMLFVLFDQVSYPILRGEITISKTDYSFNRIFSLGLPKETEPDFLFRILSDPQFSGMPPTLTIQESKDKPEWNVYYNINLEAGSGYSFGPYSFYNTAIHLIDQTIKDSVKMYELSMIERFSSMEDVEAFLQAAYRCFEVY